MKSSVEKFPFCATGHHVSCSPGQGNAQRRDQPPSLRLVLASGSECGSRAGCELLLRREAHAHASKDETRWTRAARTRHDDRHVCSASFAPLGSSCSTSSKCSCVSGAGYAPQPSPASCSRSNCSLSLPCSPSLPCHGGVDSRRRFAPVSCSWSIVDMAPSRALVAIR